MSIGEFDIAKLTLAAGDVLVVRTRPVPRETAQRIQDYIRRLVPQDVRVLVIDNETELSVLTRAEIAARTA